MGLILDTNFVIAAEREARRKQSGDAFRFLETHSAETLWITFTIAGELACGDSSATQQEWSHLCKPFPILPWTREISWQYGVLYRHLKSQGALIGSNDLWIASTALTHGMGVVTRNLSEFQRIPGLAVYRF